MAIDIISLEVDSCFVSLDGYDAITLENHLLSDIIISSDNLCSSLLDLVFVFNLEGCH